MIHTHTMSQLKTVQEPMKLLAPFGITAAASYPSYVPTTTLPTTGGTIQSSPLNYIKVCPVFLTAVGGTPRFKVTGWNTVASVPSTYIPQLLFEGTVSAQNSTSCVFTPVQSKAVIKGALALTATLVAGSTAVTLTAGTTANLVVGMTLTKDSGTGVFGSTPTIATIVSATEFTVNVAHATAGALAFSALDKIIILPSTTGLVVGQTLVTGSGTGAFGSGATVQSIDSSTQITASVNNTTPSSTATPNLIINFRGFTGFYTSATITKTQGDGKIYNATSINDSAFVLVDTLGCEIVKIEFIGTTTSGGCNAFYGAM